MASSPKRLLLVVIGSFVFSIIFTTRVFAQENSEQLQTPSFVILIGADEAIPSISDDEIWDRGLAVHFPINSYRVLPNDKAFEVLRQTCRQIALNGQRLCRIVTVRGAASPDGPEAFNRQLAHNRANVIAQFIRDNIPAPTASTPPTHFRLKNVM